MHSNDEEQRSAELTEQEIDAFANIDFDMPSSRVRSRIFLILGHLFYCFCGFMNISHPSWRIRQQTFPMSPVSSSQFG